jgi:hypothetical protein
LGATLTIFATFSGCKFKDTAKVDYFSNEGVAVNKVVNVAVFELRLYELAAVNVPLSVNVLDVATSPLDQFTVKPEEVKLETIRFVA